MSANWALNGISGATLTISLAVTLQRRQQREEAHDGGPQQTAHNCVEHFLTTEKQKICFCSQFGTFDSSHHSHADGLNGVCELRVEP